MRPAIAVLAALSILPACLGPRADASRYFTLPAAGEPSARAPVASVGLGPVTLPPYLSRPEVATRLGPAQITYSANDRWAAPLEDLASQALSEELRARLPAREVLRWPWPLVAPPEVGVSVEFLRLEADAAGGATIQARWTVSARGRAPVTGETRLHEAGAPGDVPGSVAALGRALGALAADLAAAARAPGG
jgi:uncharacterized lipoprotein YmbA